MIHKVAFILHPVSVSAVKKNFRSFYTPYSILLNFLIQKMSSQKIKDLYRKLPPHKFLDVKCKISSSEHINIFGIMCPMFPDQMMANKELANNQILKSLMIAEKLKAEIVTLAGFTSIVSDGGAEFLNKVNVSITSGNTLTVALTLKALEKVAQKHQMLLSESVVAIIGATGDIGSACSLVLARNSKKLVLCSRFISEKSDVVRGLRNNGFVPIIENDNKKAVAEADAVLIASSAFGTIFEPRDFKTGAIIVDAAVPPAVNLSKFSGERIFVVQGGRAKLGFYNNMMDRKWKDLFPENSIFGCLAESIVLSLDGRHKNFSSGKGKISSENVELIYNLALKHGIDVACEPAI